MAASAPEKDYVHLLMNRICEKVPDADFDGAVYKSGLDMLFSYLDPRSKAKIIASTGFWHHPGDLGMKHIAERLFAELEKLI